MDKRSYQCWMCRYYPIQSDEPLPPPLGTVRLCSLKRNRVASKSSMEDCYKNGWSCVADRDRIQRWMIISGGASETSRSIENHHSPASQSDISVSEQLELKYRLALSANERWLIKRKAADLTLEEIEQAQDMCWLEYRYYNGVRRAFIPRESQNEARQIREEYLKSRDR